MKIYNSLTRKKEEFVTLEKDKVGIYVCGPTVYDEPHIGHARSAYIFDVIRRYLCFKGYGVTFVRNVTDVDDKIINKAKEALSPTVNDGDLVKKVSQISKKYLDAYHEDMEVLSIAMPDKEPKATEYIPKMIKFINLLIDKGMAYEAGGDVYFDIKRAKDYGKLSNQSIDHMEVGARVAALEDKKDPLDFALWKKAKSLEPSWPSPWGAGRPGWHIECSAMSSDILGDEFDIHGGGIDLIFPHHENEIAQSEGAGKKFAKYWMHNGLLTINSEKMAKSLGNYITIKDFINKNADPDYMKLFFLSAHYRSPMDYTEEKIEEAKKEKERFLILLERLERVLKCQFGRKSQGRIKASDDLEIFSKRFEEAMDDDFNTPLALAGLFDLVTHLNRLMHEKEDFTAQEKKEFEAGGRLLLDLGGVFGLNLKKKQMRMEIDESKILKLIKERDKARERKDFKKADEIRNELEEMGLTLEDGKQKTTWRLKV